MGAIVSMIDPVARRHEMIEGVVWGREKNRNRETNQVGERVQLRNWTKKSDALPALSSCFSSPFRTSAQAARLENRIVSQDLRIMWVENVV